METALPMTQNPTQAVGKGFGIRVGAYILDTIILSFINLAVGFVIGFMVGVFLAITTGQTPTSAEQYSRWLDYLLGFLSMILYFTLFEWLYGATPAKLILGMRVVKEDGSPCGLYSAFLRGLLRFIDGLFFGIPAYMNMKSPLFQRIGDKAAATIVVGSKDDIIRQPKSGWNFIAAAVSYLLIYSVVTAIWTFAMLG